MSIVIAPAVNEDLHSSPDHDEFIQCVASIAVKASKVERSEERLRNDNSWAKAIE